MEMFFVLSGFLIGQILFTKQQSLWRFYTHRWLRTLPLYYIVLVGVLLTTDSSALPMWQYALFLQNWPQFDSSVFPVSWSLVVEEWFYLLLPLWWWLGMRLRISFPLLIGTTLLALWCGRAWLIMNGASFEEVRFAVFSRFDGLLMGVSLAYIKTHFSERYSFIDTPKLTLVGSMLFLAIHLYFPLTHHALIQPIEQSFFWKMAYLPLINLCAVMILPWMDQSPALNQRLRNIRWLYHPFTRISLYSYAIYLLHEEVARLMQGSFASPYMDVAFGYGLSLLAAPIAYHLIEKPIMEMRQ